MRVWLTAPGGNGGAQPKRRGPHLWLTAVKGFVPSADKNSDWSDGKLVIDANHGNAHAAEAGLFPLLQFRSYRRKTENCCSGEFGFQQIAASCAESCQLGLKLEPNKADVKVFVVDHADKMPTEN